MNLFLVCDCVSVSRGRTVESWWGHLGNCCSQWWRMMSWGEWYCLMLSFHWVTVLILGPNSIKTLNNFVTTIRIHEYSNKVFWRIISKLSLYALKPRTCNNFRRQHYLYFIVRLSVYFTYLFVNDSWDLISSCHWDQATVEGPGKNCLKLTANNWFLSAAEIWSKSRLHTD